MLQQPLDLEVGAGTMHPDTFLRVLGPEPWRVAYVQPSRRPADGRYGDNPFRLGKHHQFQVILKPSPLDVQRLYVRSLEAIGLDLTEHDLRFEEDNWEAPTLGAWGVGWQVMLDGMEITQFTYFQQAGGLELKPISAEITYGLERLTMFLSLSQSIYEIDWVEGLAYGQVRKQEEYELSRYYFEVADVAFLQSQFDGYESARRSAAWRPGWCCRPTSAPSSARTRSTCSTPAAPSRSPSGWPDEAGARPRGRLRQGLRGEPREAGLPAAPGRGARGAVVDGGGRCGGERRG